VQGTDGTEHPVDVSLTLVQETGARRILAQLQPLTPRTQGEVQQDFSDAVINSVPGAFYLVDADLCMVRWNSITERLSGYSADDISTMTPDQFFAPEESDRIIRAVRRVFTAGSATIECTLVTKTGRHIPFLLSGRRIMLHGAPFLIGLGIDIRDRKQMENALHESRERLDLAVAGADLGLWDWDIPTGRVTHNARWAEMLGFSPNELEPRFSTWQMLVHPDDKEDVLRRLQDHLDGKTPLYEAELRLRAKDGSWRWTLDRGKVVRRDAAGIPLRVSGTQLDITERREAENRLRESLHEKEILLREIHHRVKNNLQVISSLFNLQAQTVTDPNVLAALKESHNRVRSMGLVHHVMYQAADFAAVDLVDYVQTLTRSLYRSYAMDPETVLLSVDIANVRLGIDAAIPCGLIINELVSNALRHAYPDGRRGTLSVALVQNGDDTHTLTVKDDGIGLPDDIVLPPVATLGLALVETLSRQLGGTLSIDRTGGTSVNVRFPGQPPA
jgi:PAS domain S-box-containing protein